MPCAVSARSIPPEQINMRVDSVNRVHRESIDRFVTTVGPARVECKFRLKRRLSAESVLGESVERPLQASTRASFPEIAILGGQVAQHATNAGAIWKRRVGSRVGDREHIAGVGREVGVFDLVIVDREVQIGAREDTTATQRRRDACSRNPLRASTCRIVVKDDPETIQIICLDSLLQFAQGAFIDDSHLLPFWIDANHGRIPPKVGLLVADRDCRKIRQHNLPILIFSNQCRQ